MEGILRITKERFVHAGGLCLMSLLALDAGGREPGADAGQGSGAGGARASVAHPSSADEQTVTLIPGDRVTLRNGAPLVVPGPGRTQVAFAVQRANDHVRVV